MHRKNIQLSFKSVKLKECYLSTYTRLFFIELILLFRGTIVNFNQKRPIIKKFPSFL